MGRIDELVSAEFATWEQRGRGWKIWPEPVQPEPPFEEFTGYRLVQSQLNVDDGRRPGFLASLFDSLEKKVNPPPAVVPEETVEPVPNVGDEPLTAEFVASLPATLDVSDETLHAFLDSLDACAEPTGFEILGNHESITLQFASSAQDALTLQRQLGAFFPKLAFTPTGERLAETWNSKDGFGFIVDFGLAHEFMLPLQGGHAVDPFVGLVSVLNELQRDEVAVFQVLFQPVQNRWPASVWRSVTDENGKAIFLNRPYLIPGTKEKLEKPLFGVVVRTAAKAENFDRAADIIRQMAFALRAFTRADGNRLIPLHNEEYSFETHEADLTSRRSRRSGMLLNRDELLGFVHLPTNEVSAARLKRQRTRTKAAPAVALSPSAVLLGHNEHAGRMTSVYLSAEQRVKHTHVIGASGTGKSTLLFNLIRQDIEGGQGLAVLDPHGDLVERILCAIPAHRMDDVIFLDPTDEEFSIGFNILSAHSDFEKTLIASDLVSVFRRLSTSWGDQLNSVLNNAILAFLESSRGGTLADLRRFLLDADFRNEFLQTVRDPDVVYYWRKGFPQLGGNKSIGPVLTRLDTFLGPKPIRYMVSQTANRLDFANILDSGKIFLAKLPQGQIGKENAFLLGSLLVSKFQQLAMSRQRLSVEQRRDFWIYLDEFQNFITPSLAEILTGARKYRIGLMLAHHELHQLQRDSDVASAVISNPYTRIVFRVGDVDAIALAKGFASFDAKDLQNLGTGEAVCRMERSDGDFNLRIPLPKEPDADQAAAIRRQVVESSRSKYATARAEVEAAILRATKIEEVEPPKRKPASASMKKGAAPAPPKTDETPPTPVVAELPTPANSLEGRSPEIAPPELKPIPPVIAAAPYAAEVTCTPPPPRDLGRGGAQHQAIQRRIKKAAEDVGFKSTIEKSILDRRGSVDLLLARADHTIACEISITTTIDHEVGNVVKCLKAGFSNIAVICLDENHREKIRTAVSGSLGEEAGTRVSYYHPDQFIAYLGTFLPDSKISEEPKIRRGFRVKRSTSNMTPEEQKQREDVVIRSIAEAMQRKTK
jgi:hypothetical protein